MRLENYPVFKGFDPESIARKALIYANPLYLSLRPSEQAHYRIHRTDEDSEKITARIEKEVSEYMRAHSDQLPVIPYQESIDEAHKEIALFLYNWVALLASSGIGSPICINEDNADPNDLLNKDFTLTDYDEGYVQQQIELIEDEALTKEDFNFMSWATWIRIIIDQKFYYGTIFSVADYVHMEIENFAFDFIGELIPYDYVQGENNNKPTKGGFIWDYYFDANGKEAQLEELQDRWQAELNKLTDRVDAPQLTIAPKVFVKYTSLSESPIDHHIYIIVNNHFAGSQLTMSRLMQDVSKLEVNFEEIDHLVASEKAKAKAFIKAQYKDIEANFDPTIVKFKKRMNIVIAPNVLDDES
jgi:hypothetical protein